MKKAYFYDTPVGTVTLCEDSGSLTGLKFGREECDKDFVPQETPLLRDAALQLREYFNGKRRHFDLPLKPEGTDFEKKVWRALCDIPYGQTRTYGEVALRIGNPNASRAVGRANNRNPLAIFIPCHRVIGSNGKLIGYAGGLQVKEQLLRLEQAGTSPTLL